MFSTTYVITISGSYLIMYWKIIYILSQNNSQAQKAGFQCHWICFSGHKRILKHKLDLRLTCQLRVSQVAMFIVKTKPNGVKMYTRHRMAACVYVCGDTKGEGIYYCWLFWKTLSSWVLYTYRWYMFYDYNILYIPERWVRFYLWLSKVLYV